MPIFKSIDERFDDIEYTIESQPVPGGEWYWLEFKDALGGDHPCSRRYRSREACEAGANDELTFTMKYWSEQLNDRERAIVAEHTHYRYNPVEYDKGALNGFGGRGFTFRSLATGEVMVSHNVWFQGKIPVWAASAFPDTHEILSNI